MSSNDPQPGAAELRARAEALALGKAPSPENFAALSPEATRAMLHELQVHQIELEMQNEELRRAQVERDASWERYFDLYDLALVGYVTVSEPGLILEANLTACTLLGLGRGKVAASSLVGQPFFLFIQKEDSNVFHLVQKRIFETGEPQACDVRMVKQDGTQCWAHLATSAAQDADGAPVSRIVLSDITERKQAEEALLRAHDELEQRVAERTKELRTSDEALRGILSATRDGYWCVNARGDLLEVNPRYVQQSGYSREELLGS